IAGSHEAVQVWGRGIVEELRRRRDAARLREVVVLHVDVKDVADDRIDRREVPSIQSLQERPEGRRARRDPPAARGPYHGCEDRTRPLTHDAREHQNLHGAKWQTNHAEDALQRKLPADAGRAAPVVASTRKASEGRGSYRHAERPLREWRV